MWAIETTHERDLVEVNLGTYALKRQWERTNGPRRNTSYDVLSSTPSAAEQSKVTSSDNGEGVEGGPRSGSGGGSERAGRSSRGQTYLAMSDRDGSIFTASELVDDQLGV